MSNESTAQLRHLHTSHMCAHENIPPALERRPKGVLEMSEGRRGSGDMGVSVGVRLGGGAEGEKEASKRLNIDTTNGRNEICIKSHDRSM